MKSTMNRRFAIAFFVALLIGLVGCARTNIHTQPTADGLIGTWNAEIDLTDVVSEQLEDSLGMEITATNKFIAYTSLTLNEDGTYSYVVDAEKTATSMHEYISDITLCLEEYVYTMLEDQGLCREEADELFETQQGVSIHEYLEDQLKNAELNVSDDISGYYEKDNGKLCFAAEADMVGVNNDYCYDYELSGDILTFTNGYGDTDSSFPTVFPIVFRRQ